MKAILRVVAFAIIATIVFGVLGYLIWFGDLLPPGS